MNDLSKNVVWFLCGALGAYLTVVWIFGGGG